jgi:hypothetical protein
MQIHYPTNGPFNNILFASAAGELKNKYGNELISLGVKNLEIIYDPSAAAYKFILSGTPDPYNPQQLYHTTIVTKDLSIFSSMDALFYTKNLFCTLLGQYRDYVESDLKSNNLRSSMMNAFPHYTMPFPEYRSLEQKINDRGILDSLKIELRQHIPEGEYRYEDKYISDKIGGKTVKIKFTPKKDMTAYELLCCIELLKLTSVKGSKMAYITDHELNRHWEVMEDA